MHVVVIFQSLEKFAGVNALFLSQLRKIFRDVPQLARDHGPSIFSQPLRNRVQIGALGDEAGARGLFRDIVIFCGRKRFNILRAGFDRGLFDVRAAST